MNTDEAALLESQMNTDKAVLLESSAAAADTSATATDAKVARSSRLFKIAVALGALGTVVVVAAASARHVPSGQQRGGFVQLYNVLEYVDGDFTEQSCNNVVAFLDAVGMPEEHVARMSRSKGSVSFTHAPSQVEAVQTPALSKMCTVPQTIALGQDSPGSMPGGLTFTANLWNNGNTLRGTFNLLGKPGDQELAFTETGFTWTASAAGVKVTCAYAKSGR